MVTHWDREYRLAKWRKKSGKPLASPFLELASWIDSHYGVHVLDIQCDTLRPQGWPRLNVILERECDELTFHDSSGNFDEEKQAEIRLRFEQLVFARSVKGFQFDSLFVIFSAFDDIARDEAKGRVSRFELWRLKRRLNDSDLWRIRTLFGSVTFFFHTERQRFDHETKEHLKRYAEEYAKVVAPYDEFGYLAENPIPIKCDSKENFECTYRGKWFYYDR